MWWFPYKGQIGNVLSIPEQQLPGKKRYREAVLVVEALSQVDVIYKSSENMTLNDAREAARLALMEHQGYYDEWHRARSDQNCDKPAEEIASEFYDLHGGDLRGVLTLHIIRKFYTKYSVNELYTLLGAQSLIEDGIASIQIFIDLTDQLA